MVALKQLGAEFPGGINHGINLPAEAFLCRTQSRDNFGKSGVSHDKKVHITSAAMRTSRHRSIQESQPYAIAQRNKASPQNI